MFIKYDEKGEIKEVFTNNSLEFVPYLAEGEQLLELDLVYLDRENYYVSNGIILPKGNAPNFYSSWDYTLQLWVDDIGKASEFYRTARNNLLKEADIMIFKAEDLGQNTVNLRQYRQALRDITKQEGFPLNVIFPTAPE